MLEQLFLGKGRRKYLVFYVPDSCTTGLALWWTVESVRRIRRTRGRCCRSGGNNKFPNSCRRRGRRRGAGRTQPPCHQCCWHDLDNFCCYDCLESYTLFLAIFKNKNKCLSSFLIVTKETGKTRSMVINTVTNELMMGSYLDISGCNVRYLKIQYEYFVRTVHSEYFKQSIYYLWYYYHYRNNRLRVV